MFYLPWDLEKLGSMEYAVTVSLGLALCFQEYRDESGSLTWSGTVEHINSGDDAGTDTDQRKFAFNEMGNNAFNV